MSQGYIKLWRKIEDSPMYLQMNSKQRDVLHRVLLMASHNSNEWLYNGQLYSVKPGQFVCSLATIQAKCAHDVSIQNIRTSLLFMKRFKFLTNDSTNQNRLITICKWEEYQDQLTSKLTSNQQATNKQLTTTNNVKNDKNIYITPEKLHSIARLKSVPLKAVEDHYVKLKDYCQAHGKTYKDYEAALRNFVQRSLDDGKIKPIQKLTHIESPF